MNTQLGICIPTYKRPEQLRMCLSSVLIAVRPYDVPIFIIDDSTDDTNASVKTELEKAYPHVHWLTNDKNLGIDRNILKAVDVCTCSYAWLLGEDDRMIPEAVKKILDTLKKDISSSFIYCNYASVDEDLKLLLKEHSLPLKKNQTMPADLFYRTHAWSMGFLGACIIRTDDWAHIDPSPYLDTYYAHVGKIFEMCHGQEVYLVAAPLVLNRCGTPRLFSWVEDMFTVQQGWGKIAKRLEPLYGTASCEASTLQFKNMHGTETLSFLCYTRADRAYGLNTYASHVKPSDKATLYKLCAKLIALTPPITFRIVRGILALWRRHTRPPLPEAYRTSALS